MASSDVASIALYTSTRPCAWEFYHESHRPTHFLEFASLEDRTGAGDASLMDYDGIENDREDLFT